MAGIIRLNQLPLASGANLTGDDIFLMMDDPSGSATTKRVSLSTLSSALGSATTTVELSFNTTLVTDASSGDIFNVTLTDNTTIANPTNPVDGKSIRWRISQDSTGGWTVTLGDKFNIPSSASSPLPFSVASGVTDLVAATYHSGRDKWDIIAFVPGY
jgi:hypothetical protein